MKTIGLLGGAGSGKSFFAAYIAEKYQAAVIDGDKTGHRLLEKDDDVRTAIIKTFGEEVAGTEGGIDRRALGGKVFGKPEAMEPLNRIMHPKMKAAISEALDRLRRSGSRLVVLDAAVMIEAGFLDLVDAAIYVHADDALRLQRLTGPRGIDSGRAAAMIASGRSDYSRYADHVLDSSVDEKTSFQALDKILKEILEDDND